MQRIALALCAAALLTAPSLLAGQAGPVRAVLFYSPTCPHCHVVMSETLPPLAQRYGSRLVIATVDVSTPDGQALYAATVRELDIPPSRIGVPTLVVGEVVMVGSGEIPAFLPDLIEDGLAAGGVAWPAVAELQAALRASGAVAAAPPRSGNRETSPAAADEEAAAGDTAPAPAGGDEGVRPSTPSGAVPPAVADSGGAPAPGSTGTPGDATGAADSLGATGAGGTEPGDAEETEGVPGPSVPPAGEAAPDGAAAPPFVPLTPTGAAPASALDRYLLDPVGNSLAVGVLLVLLSVLGWSALRIRAGGLPTTLPDGPVVPGLLVAGLGVAAYLSFVEVTGAEAVCGPVGDCNTVQQSPWARLFGVLPVGVLGMAGYVAMGAAWLAAGRAHLAENRKGAARLFWLMTFVGTAFSAWLTFLEPFVIGATCAWCVTSALVMAALLTVATARPGSVPAGSPRRS